MRNDILRKARFSKRYSATRFIDDCSRCRIDGVVPLQSALDGALNDELPLERVAEVANYDARRGAICVYSRAVLHT